MTQATAGTFFTHITGWVLFLLPPILFISGQNSNIGIADIILSPFYWIFLLCYALLFYSHTFIAFPRLYERKWYLLYVLFLAAFLVLVLIVQPFDL